MRQHPIDLLPEAIRARSQAGLRTGRYIAAGVISVLILVASTTHTRFGLDHARAEYEAAREQADLVLATEARATDLERRIRDITDRIERYNMLATPLNISDVIATMIIALPDGVSLDRIDMDAGARRVVRSPRSKGEVAADEAPPRVLNAEVSGFAPDDDAIARFVLRLKEIAPFEDVTLDFSRTRAVRNRSAREFRLSFQINLEVPYEVSAADDPMTETAMSGEEVRNE